MIISDEMKAEPFGYFCRTGAIARWKPRLLNKSSRQRPKTTSAS